MSSNYSDERSGAGAIIGGPVIGASDNCVLFSGATGLLDEDPGYFTYIKATHHFGLGTPTPGYAFDMVGGTLNLDSASQYALAGNQIISGGAGTIQFGSSSWAHLDITNAGWVAQWPDHDGSNGQAIVTDGSGTLSFATVGGGGGGLSSALNQGFIFQGNSSNIATGVSMVQDTLGVNEWDIAARQWFDTVGHLFLDGRNRVLVNFGGVQTVDFGGMDLANSGGIVAQWGTPGQFNITGDLNDTFGSGILSTSTSGSYFDISNGSSLFRISSIDGSFYAANNTFHVSGAGVIQDSGAINSVDPNNRSLDDAGGSPVLIWGTLGGPLQINEDTNITGNITASNLNSSTAFIPSVTAGSNVSAVNPSRGQWLQIGDVVTLSGNIQIVTSLGGVASSITMIVPVSSGFNGGAPDAGGTFTNTGASDWPGAITAGAPDTLNFLFTPLSSGSNIYAYHVTYQIN